MKFDTAAKDANYLRVDEVATELGVSGQHVRNLAFCGDLQPVNRCGRLLLIPRATLDAYLQRSVLQPDTQSVAA